MTAAPPAEPRRAPRAAAARLFLQLRQRFRQGRDELGPGNWRAWWVSVLAGFAGMTLLMAGLVLVARWLLARGVLAGEADLLVRLTRASPFGFSDAVFFQTLGTDTTLLIITGVAAGVAAWMRRPIPALAILAAFVGSDLIVRFGWLLWARPRPELVLGGIAAPGLHAFPSGHTAKSIAVYGFLTVLWIRASDSQPERLFAALLALFIAFVVPIARLRLGAHWPTDVVAGAILGAAVLAVLTYALRFELHPRSEHTPGRG